VGWFKSIVSPPSSTNACVWASFVPHRQIFSPGGPWAIGPLLMYSPVAPLPPRRAALESPQTPPAPVFHTSATVPGNDSLFAPGIRRAG